MLKMLERDAETATDAGELPLRFVAGLPGFEGHRSFHLYRAGDGPAYWMQAAGDAAICLPLIEAFAVMPAYSLQLGDGEVESLQLGGPEDALVLAVLSVPHGPGVVTANLMAPVVVNRHTGAARQVILDDDRYSLRHPVARI